jgi:uncharacterized membrane protein
MTVEPLPSPMVERRTEQLEDDTRLDALSGRLGEVARTVLPSGRLLDELRGRSLGHALHPIMTDMPLGVWIGATVLDLTGPQKHADAARRLVGAGVLFVVPTALSGLADWSGLSSAESRRVGTVHAALNGIAGTLYGTSWLLRRSGRTTAGIATSLLGGAVVSVSGYLGGHLTLARREPSESTRNRSEDQLDWPDEG